MTRITTRMLILGALIISALGVSALGATAKTTPAKPAVTVTGGTVTISPTVKTLTDLAADKITPKPVKPAKLVGASIQAPVAVGKFNKSLSGNLILKGKLDLVKGKTTVVLSHLIVTVTKGKTAVISAVVKNKTINIATIGKLVIVPAKNGKSATASGEAHVAKGLATLVNKLAGNHNAKAGDDLGAVTSKLKLAP